MELPREGLAIVVSQRHVRTEKIARVLSSRLLLAIDDSIHKVVHDLCSIGHLLRVAAEPLGPPPERMHESAGKNIASRVERCRCQES